MRFDGQQVLVTGATRGIGEAIADAFETEGATLLLTGRDDERLKQLQAKAPASRRYMCVDFGDAAAVEHFCAEVRDLPRLDVCINNAGTNDIKAIEAVSAADFERLTNVNYRAPYFVSQAAVSVMQRQGCGRIVNIASIWSVVSKAGRSQYSGSKAAIAGMTRAMAVELANCGILVNAVSPGFILTDLTRASLSAEQMASLTEQVPAGRLGTPDEVARLVLFLSSAENTYLTGQNLVIDGGFTSV